MAPVDEIVQKLSVAYNTKQPMEFIRHQYTLDEETSYFIQDEWIKRRCAKESAEVAGYKISMTSADTQAIAKTDEPAYGTLLTSDLVNSGASISLSSLFAPLIEPEIMFTFTEDLTAGADAEEILSKSTISAGIEIPDSRYIDWFPNFTLPDLLCDNTATGLVVTSDPIQPLSLDDMGDISMTLLLNGTQIGEGHSSEVLGNPVSSVAWLSHKLAQTNKTIKQGMVVSSGTFIPPQALKQGTYTVVYSNVGEVNITVTN